ncbi:hypothetical protein LWI29_014264 [Acer saccharum]|uniref:Uncharacterized protein n=1 Tax=Acer saccharum TaxID=4024 RepID=A0AA39VRR1_ACESA|nr:hypothetical protein LWI29_014264 [Acer saccharum]
MIFAHFSELDVVELGPIVRHDDARDPEPIYYVLSDKVSGVYLGDVHECLCFCPLGKVDLYLMRLASIASSGNTFSSKYFLSWDVQSPRLGQISVIMTSLDSAVFGLVRCTTGIALDLILMVAEANLDKASAFSFSSRGI